MTLYPKLVTDVLEKVTYPGTKKNIIESGMSVDTPSISGNKVGFTLIFPRETDSFLKSTIKAARTQIHYSVGKEAEVTITTGSKNAPHPEVGKLLPQVRNAITVGSGKGGVGESTVLANLAIALVCLGYKVDLLDIDIFGPSMSRMLGIEDARLYGIGEDGQQLIKPVEKYGMKLFSIGFFVNPDTATLQHGSMAASALKRLIADADRGELGYFILDTPPGISNIHLTFVQTLAITDAVIVSTPQNVALADVRKDIDIYRNDKVNISILGLAENMAWLTPAELPENKYYVLGRDGRKNLARGLGCPLFAQVPIAQGIYENGDNGTSVVPQADATTGQSFLSLARSVVTAVDRRSKEQAPTKIADVENG